MNLNFDFHKWRGFSTGSDLFDHQLVAGVVTITTDKRSLPSWLRRLLTQETTYKAQAQTFQRRLNELRDKLKDGEE